jgi:hypothetical protein
MKKASNLFLVSLLSGAVTLTAYHYFFEKETEKKQNWGYHCTGIPNQKCRNECRGSRFY